MLLSIGIALSCNKECFYVSNNDKLLVMILIIDNDNNDDNYKNDKKMIIIMSQVVVRVNLIINNKHNYCRFTLFIL